MQKVECLWCGKKFPWVDASAHANPSGHANKFCSRECMTKENQEFGRKPRS